MSDQHSVRASCRIFISLTIASLVLALTSLVCGPAFAQDTAARVSEVQDEEPDAIAAKLIDRIQSFVVAPAPADAKKFKIYGTVLNSECKPARGIVECWSVQEDGDSEFLGKAMANLRGQFSLEIATSVKPNKGVQLIAVGFNHHIGWALRNSVELDSNGGMSIVLREPTGAVEGTLLAPGNKPMAGVELSLEALLESPGGSPIGAMTHSATVKSHTTSDENGHFEMDGLPARVHVLLRVKSKDWISNKDIVMPTSPDTLRLQIGGKVVPNVLTNPANIKLYPRCEVTGTVVDRQGQPIAGVRLMSNGGGAMTDEKGKYLLVRPDFEAWGPDESKGFAEAIGVIPPKDSQFVGTLFFLDATQIATRTIQPCVLHGELLSGRLVSAVNHKPLGHIRVQIVGTNTNMVTAADGKFRLPVQPGQREVEFTPQWMTRDEQTRFLADPNSKAKTKFKVVKGQPANLGDIAFNLDPFSAKPLRVKVVKSDGTPVAGCRVEFAKWNPLGKRFLTAGLVDNESIVDAVMTAQDGVAILRAASGWCEYVPEEKPIYRQAVNDMFVANLVTASVATTESNRPRRWSGRAEIAKIDDEIVEIELVENVRVTGRVLLNGRPLMGANISGHYRQAKVDRNQSAETDAVGSYEFLVEPPADRFTVTYLSGTLFPNVSVGLGRRDAIPADDPNHFVFPDIEVVSGTGTIHGTVLDENGKPVAGAYVGCKNATAQIWLAMMNNSMNTSGNMPSLITKTNAQGKFVFTGLHDADFSIVATDRKNDTWKERTRITEPVGARTGETDIEIVLPSMPKEK